MKKGFTLVELLVVIAIIAMLSSIAYPYYQNTLINSRRSQGKAILLDLAARLEYHHLVNRHYTDNLTLLGVQNPVVNGFYALHILEASEYTYTISINPLKSQLQDSLCGSLFYNSLGEATFSGHGSYEECWGL